MEKREFGRRDFLKMIGVTTAVGGAAVATSTVAPKVAKAEYTDKPHSWGVSMAVKELDKPSYMYPPYADADKLERFNSDLMTFSNMEINGKYFKEQGKHGMQVLHEIMNEKAINNEYGWSLRDVAFSQSGWATCNQLACDWGENYQNMFQPTVDANGPWDKGEENNALTIKKVAAQFGALATGICELNEQWIYSQIGGAPVKFIEADKPHKGPDEYIVPKKCHNAIVMLSPIDSAVAKYQYSGFNPANGRAYSRFTELITKVAEFIRMLGWTAVPNGGDLSLNVPLAIDAGLGELGRHGLLISPEYGSAVKICKVFTDMPLAHDKPITFGAAEFCKTCKKCAESCPSKSISLDPEPSYTTYSSANNPGMKRWYVNTMTCYYWWVDNGMDGCNACARACTYSKPQTWVHDVIKVTISKTSMFNSIFTKMDTAFGYGSLLQDQPENAIEDWWNDPSWTRTYDWERHSW